MAHGDKNGYTTTMDASHKVSAGGGHGTQFARHIGREADVAAGFAFGHTNGGIDPERTKFNETMVNDGAGGYRPPEVTIGAGGERRPPSDEMADYVRQRIEGKVKRKDAVALRPFVFKADPDWYDQVSPNWRTEGLNDVAKKLHEEATRFVEQFGGGQGNVAYYSDHLDEAGYPERQIAFVPVTEDGRLSQKDFFKGPSSMKGMHRELRKHLRTTCGYDADMRVAARSKEHRSSHDFAAESDRASWIVEENERLRGELEKESQAATEAKEAAQKAEQEAEASRLAAETKEREFTEGVAANAERSRELDDKEVDLKLKTEGVQQARKQAVQQGMNEGYQAGFEAGRLEGAQQLSGILVELDELKDKVRTVLAGYVHETERWQKATKMALPPRVEQDQSAGYDLLEELEDVPNEVAAKREMTVSEQIEAAANARKKSPGHSGYGGISAAD